MLTVSAGVILVSAVLTYLGTVSALKCYKCNRVEIKSSTSSSIYKKGVVDKTCGSKPTKDNSVTCSSNEVCSSFYGDISAKGLFEGTIQAMNCYPRESALKIGTCFKTDKSYNDGVANVLKQYMQAPNMKVGGGKTCSCATDYCSHCEGGIDAAGYCLKYWAIVVVILIGIAVIAIIICCCCCGCCGRRKTSQDGVPSVHAPHNIQTTEDIHSMAPVSPQAGAIGGVYPHSTGLMDKERAGYNQKGDSFGSSLA